jgi:hypothetical protein
MTVIASNWKKQTSLKRDRCLLLLLLLLRQPFEEAVNAIRRQLVS